jgi:hypothetical protein
MPLRLKSGNGVDPAGDVVDVEVLSHRCLDPPSQTDPTSLVAEKEEGPWTSTYTGLLDTYSINGSGSIETVDTRIVQPG